MSFVCPHYVRKAEAKGRTGEELDEIMRNIYANNPGKLAAWISASHVEKAPKKKDPPKP